MRKDFNKNFKRGFTLVEIILYVSLVSMIMLTISYFFAAILKVEQRDRTTIEVDQAGAYIMNIITQTIRNASSVTAPTAGVTAGSLTLVVPTGAKSPTVFDLSSGAIRVTEAATTAVPLNSTNRITASALTFQNLTASGTDSTIKIQFTLTYLNPDNVQEKNYSQTFFGTATLR